MLIESNKIIFDSPIFKNNFSMDTILKTIPLIQEQLCNPNQQIIQEGNLDDCAIYFIDKGSVETYYTRHTLPGGEEIISIETFCAK